MKNGIDTCAATQNRSNCAWVMRASTEPSASIPKRGSTRHRTTTMPIHITTNAARPTMPADASTSSSA